MPDDDAAALCLCGGDEAVCNMEGFYVCTSCGIVLDDLRSCGELYAELYIDNVLAYGGIPHVPGMVMRKKYVPYDKSNHYNQKMALLTNCDPRIPDDLFDLIEREYGRKKRTRRGTAFVYPEVGDLTKKHIEQLLGKIGVAGSVPAPTTVISAQLSEKYRGVIKNRRHRGQPLRSLRKFRNKWLQIRWRLRGESEICIPGDAEYKCKLMFNAIKKPYETVRHKYKRHNIPNLNFLTLRFLEEQGYDTTDIAEFLPTVKGRKKLSALYSIWQDLRPYAVGAMKGDLLPTEPWNMGAPMRRPKRNDWSDDSSDEEECQDVLPSGRIVTSFYKRRRRV